MQCDIRNLGFQRKYPFWPERIQKNVDIALILVCIWDSSIGWILHSTCVVQLGRRDVRTLRHT
jgi:hypothetical protein